MNIADITGAATHNRTMDCFGNIVRSAFTREYADVIESAKRPKTHFPQEIQIQQRQRRQGQRNWSSGTGSCSPVKTL